MAGLISQETLERVRAASDIVEVIGSYFPLKRAGANFTALCPFHKEKTPSFNVHPGKQIFHCFGCHKGGDVFAFVREYENIGFVDAVKRLAERASIPLEIEQSPEQAKRRALQDSLRSIHEQIARRWHTALLNEAGAEGARGYLKQRGLNEDDVKQFRLGYAPDDWVDTVNWARSKNHSAEMMEESGLVLRKEGSDRRYGRFRGRLMFPICDEQGRVIGFSGRVLDPEAKGAKYVNSPETPLFRKGRVIYGLDQAKRPMLDAQQALLCEGQLDVIACHRAGVRNAVAPQGTALTTDQCRLLRRYADEVLLCFDSDAAGQAAVARSLDALLEAGLAVRVMTIPAPHDPDSYIQEHGVEAFRARMEQAEGFFDFYLKQLCRENDTGTDRGRRAVLRAMGEAARKANDEVMLDRCAQQTALALQVSAEAVRTEFGKLKVRGQAAPANAPEVSPLEPMTRPDAHEFWLLCLAFSDGTEAGWLSGRLELEWIAHAGVREIVGHRLANGQSGAALVNTLDSPLAGLLTEALADRRPVKDAPTELAGLIRKLRDRHIDRQLARLTRQLAVPGLTAEDLARLMGERRDWQRRKEEPVAS
ncbi:MAG: DNA primase [Verrucomicrobiales bacterium]|nr:DNA primase [Verrucomicrobiales bacterium]|tara:strand:+ start:15491 stop:17263 length:1773 start_codon:yes stop_codon:yes gene_type:complete